MSVPPAYLTFYINRFLWAPSHNLQLDTFMAFHWLGQESPVLAGHEGLQHQTPGTGWYLVQVWPDWRGCQGFFSSMDLLKTLLGKYRDSFWLQGSLLRLAVHCIYILQFSQCHINFYFQRHFFLAWRTSVFSHIDNVIFGSFQT